MGRRPLSRKPSFLKILVTDFSKKLVIPSKFVRLHRGTLARKCVLRPTGTQDAWSVRTKLINNVLYFKKGWKKFAQHHMLGFGDLLVFRYDQDCEFYVDMFDKSCCIKEPQKNIPPTLSSQEKRENLEIPAIDAAEEFMASSEYPAFNRIMQSAYVRGGGYLLIKPEFEKMYLEDGIREVKIEVSGKTWNVGVVKDRSCRLSRCWGNLAVEHALKEGDVCVFQLINVEDFTLKLTIFSSTKENRNCQTKARSGEALEAHSSQALEESSGEALEPRSSQPLKAHYNQALEAHSSQALEAGSGDALEAHCSQALEAHSSQALEAMSAEALEAHSSQPLEARSSQALEARSGEDLEAHSCQPLKACSSQALEAHSSQVLEAAYKFSSLSKHPSYPCVMSFSYIQKGSLYVPSRFAKQINATLRAKKVRLQCRGNEWCAVLSTYDKAPKIAQGWLTFAMENSLQIGDACVLELINREDALIKVTIFKSAN